MGRSALVGLDFSDEPSSIKPNRYALLFEPTREGSKNAVLPSHVDQLNASDLGSLLRRLRFGSLVSSLTAIVLTYLLATYLLGDRLKAVATAGVTALIPAVVLASATAGPESLGMLLLAGSSLCYAYGCADCRGNRHLVAASGVLMGLAALAVPLGIWGVLALCVSHGWRVLATPSNSTRRQQLTMLAWVCVPALAVSAGFWVPLASSPSGFILDWFTALLIGVRHATPGAVVRTLSTSFWGLTGWCNIEADHVLYAVLDALAILSVGGLGLLFLQRRWLREEQIGDADTWRLLWIWLAVGAVASILHSLANGGHPDVIVILALPVAVLLVRGWHAWLQRQHSGCAMAAVVLVMAVLCLRFPAPALDLYAQRGRLAMDGLDPDTRRVDVAYGDDLYLVGYTLGQEAAMRGDRLELTLYWLARGKSDDQHAVSVAVIGRQGAQIGIQTSYPADGLAPTTTWMPGEIIADAHSVPISERAHTPALGEIRVTVQREGNAETLSAFSIRGEALGKSPFIGSTRILSPSVRRYVPLQAISVDFGERLELFGYNLLPSEPVSGQTWEIDLYWEPHRAILKDYTVFLHLIDERGAILAQTDEQPLSGEYPTSAWALGEQVYDKHVIAVPPDTAGGPYYLAIGLYDAGTGDRLPIVEQGEAIMSHITLGPLIVRPE